MLDEIKRYVSEIENLKTMLNEAKRHAASLETRQFSSATLQPEHDESEIGIIFLINVNVKICNFIQP